jgi:poly-gamma-glutamate synthesis protein (capsule biosynthesis protein)
MARLVMAGDVMLGRLVDEFLATNDPCYVWGDTLPLFKGADLALCNLECAVTDRAREWREVPKVFYFRTHTQNAASLKCAGIDLVTLANNHVLDFGYEGLDDTLAILDENGVAHAGAGRNVRQASSPVFFAAGGSKVAVLSFADDMPEWAAKAAKPGIFYIQSPDSPEQQVLNRAITLARKQADFVIISPHWGPNWGYEVEPYYASWARRIIDQGADMIFGHSGHVFRGIEIYKGKPIIYSAGDFVDDYAVSFDEPNDEGFVYGLELNNGRMTALNLYPTVIQNYQARFAGVRSQSIMARMAALSADLGTGAKLDSKHNRLTIPIRL